MPRYCKELVGKFTSESTMMTSVYQKTCEYVLPFVGFDVGQDETGYWQMFKESITSYSFVYSYAFQAFMFFMCMLFCFVVGIYVRRSTVLGLLHQKKEWQDKEKMLLNQLWAALEEKLEHKSMLNEAKIALEKIKVERTAEEAEKESLKSRMSTLDRNIKLLEQERNCLEEKLRECVKTFSTLRTSIGDENNDKGENAAQVDKCMEKINGLQDLMHKLIRAHRQEHDNFVALLEKKSSL